MSNAVIKISDAALSANVDKLGGINAELAALKKKADAIKDKLLASGYSEICGKSYKAVISVKDGVKLNSKLVKATLSPAQIKACSLPYSSTTVTLYDL
jgi:hypothetical protein